MATAAILTQIATKTIEEPRMPIYEYACQQCKHEFEVLVRGDETASCPQCQSDQMVKLFSVPAAHSHHSVSAGSAQLPAAGCGLPQCGAGRCAGN
jgi:putative FmdB family regulatory protein